VELGGGPPNYIQNLLNSNQAQHQQANGFLRGQCATSPSDFVKIG